MNKTLTEIISELTPSKVNDRLIIKNKRKKYQSNEMERKLGLSRYWGYSYPGYNQSGNPETHYKNCVESLNTMELRLRELFSGFQIKTNERTETQVTRLWTEESTMPLFEDIYKKGILNYIFSPFRELAHNLLKAIKKEHEEFCSDMVTMSGILGEYNPKTEKILIFTNENNQEINFSVSPNRYFKRYFQGISMEVCDRSHRLLKYQHLPILLQLIGFDYGDRQFREIQDRLIQTDFSPLRREFPYISN